MKLKTLYLLRDYCHSAIERHTSFLEEHENANESMKPLIEDVKEYQRTTPRSSSPVETFLSEVVDLAQQGNDEVNKAKEALIGLERVLRWLDLVIKVETIRKKKEEEK